MDFQQIRQKYPEYSDMSDDEFANKFHQKFYSDMDFNSFANKVGYSVKQQPQETNTLNDLYGQVTGKVKKSLSDFDLQAGLSDVPRILKDTVQGSYQALGGGAAAIGDTLNGILKMPAQMALQAGGTMSGTPASVAKKASQQAVEQTFPNFQNNLSSDTAKSVYNAAMLPMEGLTQVLEIPGKVVKSLSGDENLAANTDLATNLFALLAHPTKGMTKEVLDKKNGQSLPEGSKVLDVFKKPVQVKDVPTNFNPELYKQTKAYNDLQNAVEHIKSKRSVNETQIPTNVPQPQQGELFSIPTAEELATELNQSRRDQILKDNQAKAQAELDGLVQDLNQSPQMDMFNPRVRDDLSRIESQIASEQPKPNVPEPLPNLDQAFSDAGLLRDFVPETPNTGLPFVPEFPENVPTLKGAKSRGAVPEVLSGEHSPITEQLRLMEDFPERITASKAERAAKNRPDNTISAAHEEALQQLKAMEDAARGQQERAGTYPEQVPDNIIPWEHPKAIDERMAWEQHQAEMQRQSQAAKDIAWQRAEAERSPLTLEPEQRSSGIEKVSNDRTTYKPAGQTGMGRSQRGSIGFFGKDSYEKFADKLLKELPDATPEEIRSAYEATQSVKHDQGVANMGKNIAPSLERHLSPWKDRTTQETVDIIKSLPDNKETSLGHVSNNLMSRGRLGVQRHANEGVQAGVAHMEQLRENAAIEGNQLLNNSETGVNAHSRKLESLVGEGEAGEVYKQIFEHQLDPNNHKFNLNPRQQQLLDSIKRATDKVWSDLIEQVSKISPEKAETLSRMKQEYYIPHQFVGDFVSYVRDANGKILTFVAERTERGAKKAIEHLRNELGSEYTIEDPIYIGENVRPLSKRAEMGKIGAKMQEGLAGQFDYLIDLLGSSDAEVQRAQRAVQSVINRQALSSEGMSNRMKTNTNVGGASGNRSWRSDRANYFDAKDSLEKYINSFYEWKGNMQIADFLNQIKAQAPDKVNTYATLADNFERTTDAVNASTSNWKDAKSFFAQSGYSPKEITNFARGLSNLITLKELGFYNPIMIIQNLLQSGLTQLVQTANLYGHGANISVGQVLGNIMSSTWDGMLMGKTNPKWAAYAMEHEIGDPGLVTSHGKTKLGSNAKEYIAAKSIMASEQVSRISYFFGMTKTLIDAGVPEATALEVAKNMTRDHMGNYSNSAKPGIMNKFGVAGELAGKLQTYGVNAFTQFAQVTADMMKGIKEGNPRLVAPFAMFIASQYLVGGLNGTLPMDMLEKFHYVSQKLGALPPEWRSPRQHMLEDHPSMAVSPISKVTNTWLEGSFRAQMPFAGAPIPQKMYEMAGSSVDAVKWLADKVNPKNRVSNLEKAQVLESFLPTSVRGAVEKNYLVNSNGVMVSKGSGRPIYQMIADDQGPKSYTNLRSYERGRTSELTNFSNEREMRINTARTKLEKDFNEKLAGKVGHGEELTEAYVTNTIKRDMELGGDIDKTIQRAVNFAVEAGYPSQIVLNLIKAEKNPFKQQRMARTYQALTEKTR